MAVLVSDVKPGAAAVIATATAPSVSRSSTAMVSKATEVAPAGMVTVAGTVTWAGFAEVSVTTKGAERVPEMRTEPEDGEPSVSE